MSQHTSLDLYGNINPKEEKDDDYFEDDEFEFPFTKDITELIDDCEVDKKADDVDETKVSKKNDLYGGMDMTKEPFSLFSSDKQTEDDNDYNPKIDDDEDCDESNKITQNDNKKNEIPSIEHFLLLAKEQSSSRDLQDEMKANPTLAIHYMNELFEKKEELQELIIHPFGNYVIQKIISLIDDEQRTKFLQAIQDAFLSLSINFYGTRVLQHLIDQIQSEEIWTVLIGICCNHIVGMVTNINSIHIISRILNEKKTNYNSIIFQHIEQNLLYIAKNTHGSCFIQKIISNYYNLAQNIITKLITNCIELLPDEFGNYTISFIFSMKVPQFNYELVTRICPYFVLLANQKYCSPVLEKCFEQCDVLSRQLLYQTIVSFPVMKELLVDMYGNYVLQKAIDTAPPIIQMQLLNILPSAMFALKRDTFGKQMFSKICMKYPSVKTMVNIMKGKSRLK